MPDPAMFRISIVDCEEEDEIHVDGCHFSRTHDNILPATALTDAITDSPMLSKELVEEPKPPKLPKGK